jgi:hypothetical protein
MKKLLMCFVASLFFATTLSAQTTYLYNTTTEIRAKLKGGRGYVVPFVNSNAGLSMAENGDLTGWTNKDRKAVWYLYQQKGIYNMGFRLTLTNNSTRNFKITCTRADAEGFSPLIEEFSYTGLGKNDTVRVLNNMNIPATGYYRYELESKNTTGSITINELIFEGITTPEQARAASAPHTTDYLSSPSVHLNYSRATSSKSNDYDWLYQEVMAPTGFTPTATYWEAIGFTGGYFGMQANSDTERRILFSIWDQVDTDKYTKNGLPIPEATKDSLVSLVDKADYTKANGFGNEGTGGQSYVGANRLDTWKDSVTVKFLMNIRRDTIVSTITGKKKPCLILTAWYKAYDEEGWRYVASWRRPFASTYFSNSGSFIENFGWANGHLPRKGYYFNTFAHENSTGKWVHLNSTYGTHTDDQTIGQRIDYEHNVAPEDPTKFYLLSGGYGGRKGPNSGTTFSVTAITNYPELMTMDLKPFTDRIDTALVAEKKKAEEDAYLNSLQAISKTKWKLLSFSSEETRGESNGTNGLAAQTIDDKEETYWHSAWYSGTSSYPHQLVIDMTQPETVRRFKFVQSDGSRRWTKNLKIDVSDDNQNWSTIFDGVLPEEIAPYLTLDNDYTFRYFKLIIKDGFDDTPHTRLNEIYAYGGSTTDIKPVSTAKSVYPNPTADVIHVPLSATGGKNTTVLLKDATGKLLSQKQVANNASETLLSLTNYSSGIYFVQVIAEDNTTYKVIKK